MPSKIEIIYEVTLPYNFVLRGGTFSGAYMIYVRHEILSFLNIKMHGLYRLNEKNSACSNWGISEFISCLHLANLSITFKVAAAWNSVLSLFICKDKLLTLVSICR